MNRLRIIFLSLLVLATIAGALPVTESLAKWSRNAAGRHHRRHRRHSRAWWRRHRALQRARRERAEQRRLSSTASAQTAATNHTSRTTAAVNASLLSFNTPLVSGNSAPATVARSSQFPFDFTPPHTWTLSRRSRSGEAVFAVQTPDGRPAGTAVVAQRGEQAQDLLQILRPAHLLGRQSLPFAHAIARLVLGHSSRSCRPGRKAQVEILLIARSECRTVLVRSAHFALGRKGEPPRRQGRQDR